MHIYAVWEVVSDNGTFEHVNEQNWASWVAQLVKNLSAMQETLVLSLGQEDLLEKG